MTTPSRRQFSLEPERPYSLDLTAARLVRFDDILERVDTSGSACSRLLHVGRRPLLVEVKQTGTVARPLLRVGLSGPAARLPEARNRARHFVERSLGSKQPIGSFYRAARKDALLAAPVRKFRGLRVAGAATVFESMLTTILSQQVNLQFAYSIRRDLILNYGRSARVDGDLRWDFPTPHRLVAVGIDGLRRHRLSQAKARAIFEVADAFRRRRLSESGLQGMKDEDVIERLTAIHGVGRWTAEVTLMRGLMRPDVFPAGDLGVVKHLARTLRKSRSIASEREMREFSERWQPHRSLALVYAYAEMSDRKTAGSRGPQPKTEVSTSTPTGQ